MLIFCYDILVYNITLDDQREHLKVLLVLKENQLYAKRSKCKFGRLRVDYLGHVISKNGIAVDPRKIIAIKEWSLPKNPKAMRGFLVRTGYYQKFLKSYGSIAASLNKMLRGSFTGVKKPGLP